MREHEERYKREGKNMKDKMKILVFVRFFSLWSTTGFQSIHDQTPYPFYDINIIALFCITEVFPDMKIKSIKDCKVDQLLQR